METVTINCPAKINLALEITGRREDGYHLLTSVMQTLSLSDRVTLEKTGGDEIQLSCNWPGVPTDGSNLAHKAARLFYERLGRPCPGLSIALRKSIPAQAGLGGGSADGAGVLHGLNLLEGEPFGKSELSALGLKLGADVPFALLGGTALAGGVGEELTPLTPLPDCHILLAKPPVGVSTPACYGAYDRLPNPPKWAGRERFLAGLRAGNLTQVAENLFNSLEEPANLPEVALIRTLLLEAGALGARMTGSGSAVFGIFPQGEQLGAAQQTITERGWWTAPTHPTLDGVKIL